MTHLAETAARAAAIAQAADPDLDGTNKAPDSTNAAGDKAGDMDPDLLRAWLRAGNYSESGSDSSIDTD